MRPYAFRARLSRALNDRSIRFVITGVAAAGLLYGLTYAFARAGAPPFRGTVAAFVIAFLSAYVVQHAWTFGGEHAHSRSFPRYMAAQIASGLVSGAVARAFASYGAPPALMALASTGAAGAVSYTLSRFWVFAAPKTNQITTSCDTRPSVPNTRK